MIRNQLLLNKGIRIEKTNKMEKNKRSQKVIFEELLDQLHKLNMLDYNEKIESIIPENYCSVMRSSNDSEVFFNHESAILIDELMSNLYPADKGIFSDNRPFTEFVHRKEFTNILKFSICDLYATQQIRIDASNNLKTLKEKINEELTKKATSYTHYFPARTLGIKESTPFVLGPVVFMTAKQWYAMVKFSKNKEKDQELRIQLEEVIIQKGTKKENATVMDHLLCGCNSLVKITLPEKEINFSSMMGEIIAQTALDALSLIVGENAHCQQVVNGTRVAPIKISKIIEENGYITQRISALNERYAPQYARSILLQPENEDYLAAISSLLFGLTNSKDHKHPLLCERWATALHWYAEGCREEHDYIAVTKMATSLDVFCAASGQAKIITFLKKIFTIKPEFKDKTTIEKIVEDIYSKGRSQILHGQKYNRLEEFGKLRKQSSQLVREALIICALRLIDYQGDDSHENFIKSLGA